ncbi:5-hydroxyisourate hydrolase-like isoform X1 [Saimiri boliviensis]|uniref:5-hydroxyisourate hydrolase-like isoform X1 n=1 Tax=Saimiri boliviensis TaxID=27679 RepID=UPI003D78015F
MSSGAAPRLLRLQRHLGLQEGSSMEPLGSPLTTHVLDTASGVPARGLCLCLSRLEDHSQQWMELRTRHPEASTMVTPSTASPGLCWDSQPGLRAPSPSASMGPCPLPQTQAPRALPSYTDPDGRCPGLLTWDQMKAGTYKLTFDTTAYWRKRGQESFYPYVEVVFTIPSEAQKFHVPLLLSPWSYTTYRGS